MALTYSVAAVNAQLSALSTEIGASPILLIRTGSAPATVASASTGTVLSTMTLPSTPFASPSAGSMAKSGAWSDASADATGTAGHFEIRKSDGTTVVARGSVAVSGADLNVSTVTFVSGDSITITTFTITGGNLT